MKLSLTLAATLFAGLLSSTANAVTDTVTINLSGTLTRPPCNLTSSKTLTANFGSLRYDQVADAALIDIGMVVGDHAQDRPRPRVQREEVTVRACVGIGVEREQRGAAAGSS